MYTTPEVCILLGCSQAALSSWLLRNEKYKPAKRTRAGFLWEPDEVERVREARNVSTARNRNKPKRT